MAKKHMKKCSLSLTIKAMKIKTRIKIPPYSCKNNYHQKHKQQMLAKMWGKRDPHSLLMGM
jgi:hypothetical protein